MKKRTVLWIVGVALVVTASPPVFAQVQTPINGSRIPQFVDDLPVLGNGIPLAFGFDPATGASTPIELHMCEFQTDILPVGALSRRRAPPPAWVWGYRIDGCPTGKVTDSYIGPVVIAKKGTPTQVTYVNELGNAIDTNVLAYKNSTDLTLMWADPLNTDPAEPGVPPPPANTYPPISTTPTVPAAASWALGDTPEANYCAEAVMHLPAGMPPPPGCDFPNNYLGPIPAAPHLHGGEIPAFLDGGPDSWWTANGIYGHGYYTREVTALPALPDLAFPAGVLVFNTTGKTFHKVNATGDAWIDNPVVDRATYTYLNTQDAAPIWFHDHVLGATRLNVYAGIAGAYMIIDPDLQLPAGLTALGLQNGAPAAGTAAATEELLVPLVIQDRKFDSNGQLFFDNVGINPEHPYWVPEFVGDTIAVNGKTWPNLNVEPKRYRFLFLNGSNARAYELYLTNPAGTAMGPSIWLIGTDQGYLDAPVEINPAAAFPNNKLIIMPGERYEAIIDFSGAAGTKLVMRNTAGTPYPGGGRVNPRTTAKIMQFTVGANTAVGCPSGFCGTADPSYDPSTLGAIRPVAIERLVNPDGTPATRIDKVRRLTVNENIGLGGPMEVLVNNTKYLGDIGPQDRTDPGTGQRLDFKDITTQWNTTHYSELPNEGETEIWEIVNVTADAHPIHPHLVAFQILNRQPFDALGYDQGVYAQAFGGGGFDPLASAAAGVATPYPPNVYMPGYGPPLDYNCGDLANQTTRGVLVSDYADPANGCTLGGNPPIPGDPNFTATGNAAGLWLGPPVPPLPTEWGWKDTAISYPGEVLRLLIRFAPTHLAPNTAADTSFYEFQPGEGHGYVWHCHIIDHEDNEMMRPFSVGQNTAATTRTYVKGVNY